MGLDLDRWHDERLLGQHVAASSESTAPERGCQLPAGRLSVSATTFQGICRDPGERYSWLSTHEPADRVVHSSLVVETVSETQQGVDN